MNPDRLFSMVMATFLPLILWGIMVGIVAIFSFSQPLLNERLLYSGIVAVIPFVLCLLLYGRRMFS